MNASGNYVMDILLTMMGLYTLAYLIYGKIKRRPFIGGYKPGMPGYSTFLKLVDRPKYLMGAIIVTLFFIINAVFDARSILRSSRPHSILIIVPIMVILAFILTTVMVPPLLGKGRNKK